MIFSHGLPWALLGALLAPSYLAAWGYVAAYAVLRGEVALRIGAQGLRDPLVRRKIWMIPLRDAFAFVVWLASFFPQQIHWRGQQFYVRDKRLVPVSAPKR